MTEDLDRAIDALGELKFSTGGETLTVVTLCLHTLVIERQRRVDELRDLGIPCLEVGAPRPVKGTV